MTSLVTLIDSTTNDVPKLLFRRAVTTFEHIYLEHLIITMGYADSCLMRPSQFLCQAWYCDVELHMGRPLPGWSGYSIEVQVARTPTFTGLCEEPRVGQPPLQQPVLDQAHGFIRALDHMVNMVRRLHAASGFDLHSFELVETSKPAVERDAHLNG